MSLLDDVWGKVKDLPDKIDAVGRAVAGLPSLTDITGAIPSVDSITTGVIDGVRDRLGEIAQGAISTMADGFFASLGGFLTTHFGGAKLPELKPIDASEIVSQIAEAVGEAEKTLNAQGLVISQGTVELDIYVKAIGDGAGARAHMVLNITPRV